MEQFGKKSYLSPDVEILKLAEDVVTESISIDWDWDVDDGFAE